MRHKSKEEGCLNFVIGLLFLMVCFYLFVSFVRFSFVHPWMTNTEKLVYVRSMLVWDTVKYKDARPRD